MVDLSTDSDSDFSAETPVETGGLRMTKQRQEVYRLLLAQRDHPTAQDVFMKFDP